MPEYINIEVSENHFVEIQTQQIRPVLRTIIELLDKKQSDESVQVSPFDAHLVDFMDDDIIWRGSREVLELSQKLKNFEGIEYAPPPHSLNAELREYQQEGLNWLNFLYEFSFSGILADDMGLGKTIQTLAHLSRLKEAQKLTKPSLIVMPTSLVANWKNEAKKFTPNLKLLVLHGNERAKHYEEIAEHDIILTTYSLVVRDADVFLKHRFSYIILDEAQKIKNPKTKMAITLKKLKSEHRLALSGTPIENHLGELWSIFSFLMPGFLDTLSFFRNYYQLPIEKEHNFERQNLLNKRVKPFMIRRTKERVASELPAKSEIVKYTQFDAKQSKLYESIRVTMEKKVQEAVKEKGLGSSHITILDALLKLRQVCCDPSLLKIEEAQKLQESAKLELFLDLIDELMLEGRKVLVFSQFTSMLAILEENIKARAITYSKLTGATRKREEAIEKFTKDEADIFLISLKAGGVGLNLVEADTVIHYDPWWNPAVENQATDRAYRIGQTKAVFVYKLIVENTIEQKILELQEKKKAIGEAIYDEHKGQEDLKLSGNELLELLS
jgi:SNF2 family DNA or RNA helicase